MIDHATGSPPEPVRRPVMLQRWSRLTFLHWAYPPSVVRNLLPPGLEPETFDGSAWVGLVPFHMEVRPPVTALPIASRFPETNVRTYVVGPDGGTGIFFLSLDAANLPPVLAARAGWWLPYMWSEMEISGERAITYTCRRRWPGPEATSRVTVEPGERLAPAQMGAFEHYLVSRFRLYSRVAGVLLRIQAEHPPWRLRRAEVLELEDGLVPATGLPSPAGAAVAHFSEGVDVRIGAPRPTSSPPRSGPTAADRR